MAGTINVTTQDGTGVNVVTVQVPGVQGPTGPTGAPGPASVLTIGTTTTGAAGSAAHATLSGVAPNQVLNLTIPQGLKGDKGDPNTLTIGTVTTVDALTGGSATVTGTAPNQVLNLVVPRGYGVIPGGTTGQVLAKASGNDYDTAWAATSTTAAPSTLATRDSTGALTASQFITNSAGRSAYLKTTSPTDHAATIYQAGTTGVDTASALNVVSDNPQSSAMYLSGTETNRGTLKIAHRGYADGSDSGAAAVSIDVQTAGSATRAISIWSSTGGTTGDAIDVRLNNREDFVVKSTGRVGIGIPTAATPAGKLEINQNDDTTPGLTIKANSATASNLIEFKRSSDGAVRTRVDAQGQLVTQQNAYFTGSGIQVGSSSTQFAGGSTGVIGITNASTLPTGNPTGGGVLYSDSGTLKWLGPAGGAVSISNPASANISDAASVATASVVMKRDANGRAQVVDPAVAADIATKNYVDTHVPTINDATTTTKGIVELAGDLGGTAAAPTVVGGTHHTHTSSQISDATASATASTVVIRDASGNTTLNQLTLGGAAPQTASQATRKDYVDGKTWPSSAISDATSAATASKVIIRDANGRASVADPSASTDIATKNYVDTHAVPSNLGIGTVTTGAAGSQAAATITGTAPNQVLNLTIPTGATGAQGPAGPTGNGVLFLNAGDAVPAGTPANTVIYRPNTVKTSTFFWGSGTAFPTSTAVGSGDTYFHSGIAAMFVYNGFFWRQQTVPTVASYAALTAISTNYASALHTSFRVYESDTLIEWEWNGSVWVPVTGQIMGKLWCTSGSSGSMNATQEYPLIPLSGQRLSGGMTATSTQLTLPLDGLYDIWGSWYYTNAAAGFVNGWIVRNRAAATANICIVGAQYKANSGYDLQTQAVNRSVPLKAGDKLSLSTYSYTAGVAWFGSNESQGTMFSAAWVGPLNGATPL